MPRINSSQLTIGLILILVSSVFASQNYHSQYSFAQNDSGKDDAVLSCNFVQFCSNPIEITRNTNESLLITPSGGISTDAQVASEDDAQVASEDDAQVASEDDAQVASETPELIPDVTSNISLIMTPDLPINLSTDELQNPVDQGLQKTNDTVPSSINNTTANNLGITTENTTVITPDLEVSRQTIDENVTFTIQDELENDTDLDTNNQSEISNKIPPSNLTSTPGQSANPELVASNETIDSTASNETIDSTASNETIDSTASNETIAPTPQGIQQQDNLSANTTPPTEPQSTPEPSPPSQSSPTAFLDPIINPFKELFGIK
jgi:hypothetical protein